MTGLGPKFGKISSKASQVGLMLSALEYAGALKSGDNEEIIEAFINLSVSIIGMNNPGTSLIITYFEKTYGTAIMKIAETAANVNASFNSDPVGFM